MYSGFPFFVSPHKINIAQAEIGQLISIKKQYTCKVGEISFYNKNDLETISTDVGCLILYQNCYYLNHLAFTAMNEKIKQAKIDKRKTEESDTNKVTKFTPHDPATLDQIAAVMLMKGTPQQQIEALEYAGAHALAAKMQKELDDKVIRLSFKGPVLLAGWVDTLSKELEKRSDRSIMNITCEDSILTIRFEQYPES